jgi:DNA-binding NarL/FixJ family response regulator
MMPGVIVDLADSGAEAVSRYAEQPADVVVTEMLLPDFSGLELCRRLKGRWRRSAVLFASVIDDPSLIRQALDAGALGYVSRNCRPSELIAAVRGVSERELYIEHALATRLAVSTQGLADSRLSDVTQRELEIMILIARGSSSREVAQCLNISAKTVANHLAVLKGKLGISSSVELLHLAADAGLVNYGKVGKLPDLASHLS